MNPTITRPHNLPEGDVAFTLAAHYDERGRWPSTDSEMPDVRAMGWVVFGARSSTRGSRPLGPRVRERIRLWDELGLPWMEGPMCITSEEAARRKAKKPTRVNIWDRKHLRLNPEGVDLLTATLAENGVGSDNLSEATIAVIALLDLQVKDRVSRGDV